MDLETDSPILSANMGNIQVGKITNCTRRSRLIYISGPRKCLRNEIREKVSFYVFIFLIIKKVNANGEA